MEDDVVEEVDRVVSSVEESLSSTVIGSPFLGFSSFGLAERQKAQIPTNTINHKRWKILLSLSLGLSILVTL